MNWPVKESNSIRAFAISRSTGIRSFDGGAINKSIGSPTREFPEKGARELDRSLDAISWFDVGIADSADIIGSVEKRDSEASEEFSNGSNSADIIGSVVIIGAVGTIDSEVETLLSKMLFTESEAMEFIQE